jgi:3-oxoisoapionate decarboxylase
LQQLELAVSWGAPNGIELGSNRRRLDELFAWIDVAADLGANTMRIVAGGPAWAPTSHMWPAAIAPLRSAAALARSKGLVLALENHGDLTAAQIRELLDAVADEALGVCFDAANALRVGDVVTDAAALLAPDVRMLHLKDVEPLDNVTDPIAGPRSVPYGTGVIPVIDVLHEIGIDTFRGLVCVEVGQLADGTDERAFVRDSVKWLRDIEATDRPTSSSPEVQHASD